MTPRELLPRVELHTKSLIEQARQLSSRGQAECLLRHHLHQLLLQSGAVAEALRDDLCADNVSVHLFDTGRVIHGRSAVGDYWAQQFSESAVVLFDQFRAAVDEWGVITEQVNQTYRQQITGIEVESLPLSTVNVFTPDRRIEEIRIYPAKRPRIESIDARSHIDADALAQAFAPLIAQTKAMLR